MIKQMTGAQVRITNDELTVDGQTGVIILDLQDGIFEIELDDEPGHTIPLTEGEFVVIADLDQRIAALEAALAACQAAPPAAGLTVGEVDLLYDAADALSQGHSCARDVAMGIELQALARRLEAAASEAPATGKASGQRVIEIDLTTHTVKVGASGDMTPADARLFVANILQAVRLLESEASEDGSK